MTEDVLDTARIWLAQRREVALATVMRTWGSSPRPAGSLLAVRDDGLFVGSVSGGCVETKVVEVALEVIGGAEARLLELGVANEAAWQVGLACGGTVHVQVEPLDLGKVDQLIAKRLPPLRLVIVGAVHIAQSLAEMARLTGYAVTVVDPREIFASPERFPGSKLSTEWPQDAFASLAPDAGTAVVALTHDPKIDEPALTAALASDAFYIGALGSKKSHAARLTRLREAGMSDAQLARIHGPVGLAIGATSPAEIAVSIMAELTQCLRRPDGASNG